MEDKIIHRPEESFCYLSGIKFYYNFRFRNAPLLEKAKISNLVIVIGQLQAVSGMWPLCQSP
jgi:hypothetical protein